MNWNKHSYLEGQHAFLGPSKHAWLHYDAEKLTEAYRRFMATQKGTELHQFASNAIELGIRLPKTKATLNMYVNDAIGYHMRPEQPLYFSWNCFGTADAICFRDNKLRIHDLKTGRNATSFAQLELYAAIFCHEYKHDPASIEIELRIYQSDEVRVYIPECTRISDIMKKVVDSDKVIDGLRKEV